MNVDTLLWEIREFWAELKVMREDASPVHPPPLSETAGGPAMPPSGQQIIFHGNVYGPVSTGSHSAALAGTGHTAHIDHGQGADLAVLAPVLEELAKEIDTLTSAKARDKLSAQLQVAQTEAVKKAEPDAGVIKQALDSIKSGAEFLDDGGKIIGLCSKAYNLVAPFLGLPPSPLP